MSQTRSSLLRPILYGAVFGIVVYALVAVVGDLRQVTHYIEAVPWWVILGACALSVVNYALRFLRWHAYLTILEIRIPLRSSALIFFSGLVMAISPGKMGEVIKSALLKRSHQISIARSAPIVFAERLTDLLGLFVIAAVGVILFRFGVGVFLTTLAFILVAIAALQSPGLVHRLLDLVEKLPVIGAHRESLNKSYRSTRALLHWRPMGWTTALTAVAWSMEALAFTWMLIHLGAPPPVFLEAFFVFSTATLVGALSFLPGGLGATEASLAALLLWLEVFQELSPALAATYLIRFTTLWFGVLVGLLAFLLYEMLQTKQDQATSSSSTADCPEQE